jgi:hypothetical protein
MKFPNSLDPEAWQPLGTELGRRNVPAQPDGDAPVRTALRAVLATRHRHERDAYLRAVEALDVKRGNLERQLQELHTQSQTDSRQTAALPTALAQREAATRARQPLHERFIEAVRSATGDAELCDAAWRVADEDARDRRLIIDATQFVLAPGLLDPVPDPYA